MNEMIRKRNEQLAKTVIKGLQSRNMSGYYAEDKEAALKQALELTAITATMQQMPYRLLRQSLRKNPPKRKKKPLSEKRS